MATTTTVDDRRETVSLIGSDKVEGTAVYGANDERIGSVQRVMIDKISGKVAYAVVSFGGFLGIGEDYYPMPWSRLKYDTRLGGYKGRRDRRSVQGCAEVRTIRKLGLVEPDERRARVRLLQYSALVLIELDCAHETARS